MKHNDFLPHRFLPLCHNLLERLGFFTSVVSFLQTVAGVWLIWSGPMCWNLKRLYFACWSSVLLPQDGTELFRRWKALLFGQDCIHTGLRFCVLLPVITEKNVFQPLSSKPTPHIYAIHRTSHYILPLLDFNSCQKAHILSSVSQHPVQIVSLWNGPVNAVTG